MDGNPEQKPAEAVSPEIPGMKEARARMDSKYWDAREGNLTLTQEVMRELAEDFKNRLMPTVQALEKVAITFENPLVLATALPLVQNMRINRALADIASVPEGQTMIDDLGETKVKIQPDPRFSGGSNIFFPSYKNGEMTVKNFEIHAQGYAKHGTVVAILLHELHHERQVKGGVMKVFNDKVPSPVEQLWYERAMEADAQATATDIAWKLKEAGKPAAWNALAGGFNCMGHIAKAYERNVDKLPNAVATGTAKRAAFDAWFTAKNMFGDSLSEIYNTQALQNMPSAENMDAMKKAGKPFTPLTVDDIAKLGDIAEVNYLKAPGGKPLDSIDYRRADYNAWQSSSLNFKHQVYDEIKAGTYQPPGVNSKFTVPKEPAIPNIAMPTSAASVVRASKLKLY
ncbi:MAG: hypothetical protein K0R10_2152 [Alphaproteobacteria bacterium]|jgi:hypothetical protein|nr:hypothetical protein [Alphaproteobacteria bacterium]